MRWLIGQRLSHLYDVILTVFANTGQEREECLEFVRDCDTHLGFGTTWIEGVQHHGERKGAGFRTVDFHTAARNGEPFEDSIRKYGIPNQGFRNCTTKLKTDPMGAWTRAQGWATGTYDTAIGIRADEIDRINPDAAKLRLIYPLATMFPTTKPQINTWWAAQPFRLQSKGYQGNCKWCWKKSDRKHFTLIEENVIDYEFPLRMERLYGDVGPEFRKEGGPMNGPEYRRTFFRSNRSTMDMILAANTAITSGFARAGDDAQVFDPDFDVGAGCGESCEVYSDDDAT